MAKKEEENISCVKVGSKVKLLFGDGREDTFQIVPFNGDTRNHTISAQSPLASAILGKKEGEEVIFFVMGNKKQVKILKIS
jgi:transcription elongation GreA/GreB family factor